MKKGLHLKIILLLVSLTITGCGPFENQEKDSVLTSEEIQEAKKQQEEIVIEDIQLQNDFTGAKIEKDQLLQGCIGGKDCIPSIDEPKFESLEKANNWLDDEDIVFTINYKEVQRAYPQRIMNWHEIVNDEIAGDKIAVTFCPLCGSALAFEREIDGVFTEFGVSGKLHNSDLVMYDRYEGNLWQQITGEAIVGPAARRDEKLTKIPITTTSWGEWKTEHPETEVLSRETGFTRNYAEYPYGTYESDNELYFGLENLDQSLQIKTVVYGIEIDGETKAYPENEIEKAVIIEDELAGTEIKIEKLDSGKIKFTNLDNNEEIIAIRLFWFAWASFNPGTEIYQSE